MPTPYATRPEPLAAERANLARQEGSALFSAAEAILKGILEADLAVHQSMRKPPLMSITSPVM